MTLQGTRLGRVAARPRWSIEAGLPEGVEAQPGVGPLAAFADPWN